MSVRFWLHETSFCFVCSHLASGGKEGDQRRRNANAAEILSRTTFPPGPFPNFTTKILDHEYVYTIFPSRLMFSAHPQFIFSNLGLFERKESIK